MTGIKSQNAPLNRFSAYFDRWRLAFLFYALAYALALLLTLMVLPLNWDEIVHLNAALYINGGDIDRYLSAAFYPPLFDSAVAASFNVFGISLFSARLATLVFSVLALWVTFELARSMFDGKTAFLSSLLLGLMPGYFWLSRLALIEMTLVFFIVLGLLLFIKWVKTRKDLYMLLCGATIGLGILSKYQAIIIGAIVLFSIMFLERGRLKHAFLRFGLLVVGAGAVVVPWLVVAFVYGDKLIVNWLYAVQIGNPDKAVYSVRYPAPIFYLIDVFWPYEVFHPISIFIYALCLAGLGFMVWRHRRSDKIVLFWFLVIFVFFSLIANKEWRYVIGLFPALAMAAATLITHLLGKLDEIRKIRPDKTKTAKAASIVLITFVACACAYSVYDAYTINSYFNINIPTEAATTYAIQNLTQNRSIMVLCAFDYFSADMVRFYLIKNGDPTTQVHQYPDKPADTYTPAFNLTEFMEQCKENNVQYVFTYEYGATVPYFNTTLTLQQIYRDLYDSGNFTHISSDATFGQNPRRIFIIEFIG